jgi:hypothetical protein
MLITAYSKALSMNSSEQLRKTIKTLVKIDIQRPAENETHSRLTGQTG